MALVRLGWLNKQIAARLFLTEGTVKEYLNRIFHKLHMRNRTELAVWAVTRGPAFIAELEATLSPGGTK